jgi:acetoin utilization protein AcuB
LSVYEVSYLLSKLTVEKVMTKKVITVGEDVAIEDAARLWRTTISVDYRRSRTGVWSVSKGELAKISSAIAEKGGNIIVFGTIAGEDPSNVLCSIKADVHVVDVRES